MNPQQLYLPGSLKRRFFATIIDSLLVSLISAVVSLLLITMGLKFAPFDSILLWIAGIFYAPIMISRTGATIGKKLLHLRVVSSLDQNQIGFGKALLREWLGKIISGIVLSLGYFWSLIDPKNQGWHDKIANTLVVAVDAKGDMIPVQEQTVSTSRKVLFGILIILQILQLLVLPALVLIYLFVARPVQIRGSAMAPIYQDGQFDFTSPLANNAILNRGDVVIANSSQTPSTTFIKRVIGLPGETIKINKGQVFINEVALDESVYLQPGIQTNAGNFLFENKPFTIPDKKYFLMGDNRPHSSDSRESGPVDRELITRKVTGCYWNCFK